MKFLRSTLAGVLVAIVAVAFPVAAGAQAHGHGRIFVLMVWDGLRPDFVTRTDTPALYALAHEGVLFERQHAQFPTVTIVNASALATGAPPSITGMLGDSMYLGPALEARGVKLAGTALEPFGAVAMRLEDTRRMSELNGPEGFKGDLLGIDSVVQEIGREGGYTAVVGKQGPAFLFDDRVLTVTRGKDDRGQPHADFMFATDDAAAPPAEAEKFFAGLPEASHTGVWDEKVDDYFTKVAIEGALPQARKAAAAGHPALVVIWLHNPDLTQHRAGLGTLPAIEALHDADFNLAAVRSAIRKLGIADETDLMVVSDHGFATIRLRVNLAGLLVEAGLKKSMESSDVIVAPNGGSDLVYLSRSIFKTPDALRDRLQKIVNFAEAQEWCGPIFSREAAPAEPSRRGRHRRRAPLPAPYLGWIDGTFTESAVGAFDPSRSPDLIVSFGEVPDLDNRAFTGPAKPAFALGAKGQQSVVNNSQPIVHPVKGLVYADVGQAKGWTTGMGMHGAAGVREIHNFCAAAGPDFKHGFRDTTPTGNVDVTPTIEQVLGVMPNVGPHGAHPTGRAMSEALAGHRPYVGVAHQFILTTNLVLQGVEAISRLRMTRLGDRYYLDGSDVERKPLGSSP
jgi:Type I phosphodiesterase / nucleotide pyrophosphatase